MTAKKIISILFLLTVFAVMGWLFPEATKPEVLPVGSYMPVVEYETPNGKNTLKPDNAKITIVVLFHRNCDHCVYQLNQFNDHLAMFREEIFFFLTTEENFYTGNAVKDWPKLMQAQNVNWGIVEKKYFKESFGSTIYPGIYIFDQRGKLAYKIHGEVKLAKIIKIIQNFGGPERQISGNN